ncbi:TBCC domain-containing protein 1 [Tritrichomonas musculus]|uniref:TBCC domain-containing protein 1 n=1 Tax=Tritrichomonas musculus TaxID=1915356 RepID=A0ABR2KS64_9EUKA
MSGYRLWLSWETFEVAAINSLLTADITLEKIKQLAEKLQPLTESVSYDKWKTAVTSVFRLNDNQVQALYATLTCFLTKDAQQALIQSQVYLTEKSCLPSFFTRGTDILCYLFAIFVKKKFRGVSELSNLEMFPNRKEESSQRLKTTNREVSLSAPAITNRLKLTITKEQSLYPLMVRFFYNKLPQFLSIYAPDGLTRQHVESFSLLVHGGPDFAHKANSLANLMGLFKNDEQVEPVENLINHVKALLTLSKSSEDLLNRYDQNIVPTSPLAYRPFASSLRQAEQIEGATLDKPLLFEYEATHTQEPPKYILEVPETPCDVHIYNYRHATVYICSSVSTVFITRCRDSTIFVGAAVAIHLDNCQNVKIICATRMAHIEACERCTCYFLINTRPIVTRNCSRLVFAPYNALYTKFGLDTLCTGINPQLNLWDQPIVLGSFGGSLFEKISPANFRIFVVPMSWANVNPIINTQIPDQYLAELEKKKNSILTLKSDLEIIKGKDPKLYEQLVDKIHKTGSKCITEGGQMQEIIWLTNRCQNDAS